MKTIPKAFLSSTGSGDISLTVKGLTLMVVMLILNYTGVVVDQVILIEIINNVAILISAGMTLWGLIRKLENRSR